MILSAEQAGLPAVRPGRWDMTGLSVEEGISTRDITAVYSDPYILRVGHDDRPAAPIHHPAVTYLSARIDGQFVGAFMSIEFSDIEYELHALLHRKAVYRSRELTRLLTDWAFSHPIERVTAYIIEGLESAFNFCRKIGFTYEGTRRNACRQGGVLKDVYVLGMTRAEWSETR